MTRKPNYARMERTILEQRARIEAAEKILHRIVDMDGSIYEEVAWPIVEELAIVYFAALAAKERG